MSTKAMGLLTDAELLELIQVNMEVQKRNPFNSEKSAKARERNARFFVEARDRDAAYKAQGSSRRLVLREVG